MSYVDDLNQAAAEALAASSSATDSAQIMFDVANGDVNSTITTANGEVKTIAKAIKDIIDSIEAGVEAPQVEPQTLSAGQTTVTLTTMTTEGIAVYVEGSREFDFTVVNSTDFDFSQSFPDGTRIWVVKRDIEGVADSFTVNSSTGSQTLSNALDQRVIYVDTIENLKALDVNGLVDKQAAKITTTGRAGDFTWLAGDQSGTLVLSTVAPESVNATADTITATGHGLSTGDGVTVDASVNGLTADELYWVIKTDDDNFQLAASYSDAQAGTQVDLTGTSNFTTYELLDPLEGVYVTLGGDRRGVSGAFERQASGVFSVPWFGGNTELELSRAFKMSIFSGESFTTQFGGYPAGFPTIYLPKGVYEFDLSTLSPISEENSPLAISKVAGIKLEGAGAFQTTVKITGDNWLIDMGDWIQWLSLKGIHFAGYSDSTYTSNNGGKLVSVESLGAAKHVYFEDLWCSFIKNYYSALGSVNSDHFKAIRCMFEYLPSGQDGFLFDNPQAVNNVLVDCDFHYIRGTGIRVNGGGPLTWIGGSVFTWDSGRFLHVEGSGATIGVQNNRYTFIAIKPEMYGDSDFVYSDAPCIITFNSCNLVQDARNDTGLPAITSLRGRVEALNSSFAWPVLLAASGTVDSGLAFENFFLADNCYLLNADPGELLTVEDETVQDTALGRGAFRNCYGELSNVLKDTEIGTLNPTSRYAHPLKRAVFVAGTNKSGTRGLPGSSNDLLSFEFPTGSTIVRAGIVHKNTGNGGQDYQYEIRDGAGSVVHASPVFTHTEDGNSSSELFRDSETAATKNWSCVSVGTSTATQNGWVYIDYI